MPSHTYAYPCPDTPAGREQWKEIILARAQEIGLEIKISLTLEGLRIEFTDDRTADVYKLQNLLSQYLSSPAIYAAPYLN